MGVRRAHDVSVCLTVEVKVVAEPPLAADEAMVLYAWNGLTDTKIHELPPTALLFDVREFRPNEGCLSELSPSNYALFYTASIAGYILN